MSGHIISYMDSVEDLDERSQKLGELGKANQNTIIVPLSVMSNVISEISSSEVMKSLFGESIMDAIGICSIGNDLRMIVTDKENVSDGQREEFETELNRIIKANA